jgi:hypothetical protein
MLSKREAGWNGYLKTADALRQKREEQHNDAVVLYGRQAKCCPCGTRLTYAQRRGQFCSKSCSGVAANAKRHPIRVCARCGISRVINKRKYCGPCFKTRPNAVAVTVLSDVRTDASRKRILIAERGRRCEVCFGEHWQAALIPIELDHIDGNSDNNEVANLRLICPNCHAQTSTYKARNKGRAGSRGQLRATKKRTAPSSKG